MSTADRVLDTELATLQKGLHRARSLTVELAKIAAANRRQLATHAIAAARSTYCLMLAEQDMYRKCTLIDNFSELCQDVCRLLQIEGTDYIDMETMISGQRIRGDHALPGNLTPSIFLLLGYQFTQADIAAILKSRRQGQ